MLPILILGGAAAAALFLSGCDSGSQSQSIPPQPHPILPSGSSDPRDRFSQSVRQFSEGGRTSPLSSSSVLFTPGGASTVATLIGKKDTLPQAQTPSTASPISSIGDFYRRKESQKAVPGSSLEDGEFSFALGAKILTDAPPAAAEPPPPLPEPAPVMPRKVSAALSYQPRFD